MNLSRPVKRPDIASAGDSDLKVDGNTTADPVIASCEDGKVRYGPQSPVTKMGIKPIDVSSAGPHK